jgi:RNA polymerase sigma-70 factor (ECF subfamily)
MLHNENYAYKQLSDNDLFDLVKQDDHKAFEEIYSRYWNFLTMSASTCLKSKQKAEDVVQEIFISFYNRRYAIEFTVSLRAYLCKALKFKIMNESRSQIVRDTYQKAVHYAYSYAYGGSAYHLCETKELENNLNRSIGVLPQKCRQAFLLSREEDLSYKDISGHMGISVSTVEKHISKALRILKLSLNGKDFSSN